MNYKTSSAITLLFVLFNLSSCVNLQSPKDKSEPGMQWVYISAEVITLNDSTHYFYYGQLEADKMNLLNEKNPPLFLTLKNIRYWNNDDKLEIYEDSSWLGTKFFRTGDIVKIDLLKDDPVLTLDKDDLAENSLKFKEKLQSNLSSKK